MSLAAAAAALAVSLLPEARAARKDELLAAKLLNRHSLPPEIVEEALARANARRAGRPVLPEGEFATVVAASWLSEHALSRGDARRMDERREAAVEAARRSLRADPLQAFAWLVLFRNAVLENGYSPELAPLLRITYRLAPREGWLGLRRIAVAAPLGDALTPEDRSRIAAELVDLVRAGQVAEVVDLLARPAAAYRALVTAEVATMPDPTQRLYRRLARAAGFDVERGLPTPPKRMRPPTPAGWPFM